MIKKILTSILLTLLFTVNVFASNASVEIDINNNVANIKLNGIDNTIHALQLDIIDENGNTDITFEPSKKFTYSFFNQKTENGKTSISIVIDDGGSITQNGTLNVGSLTFKNKPNLNETVKLELVNLGDSLKGNASDIKATITIKEESTTSNNSGNISSGGGANIGASDNKTEVTTQDSKKPEAKPENKPETKPTSSIDIDKMYPVVRESNFEDISNHWANEPIKYLADRGIINGMDNNTFAPNDNITRAEFITLLAKMDNININKHKSDSFTDVPSDAWFNPYVDWALKNGITSGTSETTFAPNDNITREQMAVMIERFAQHKGFKLDNNKAQINFNDSANISSYASSAVAKVQQAGIINGRPDGSFAPKDNATRGESAQMIYTMLTIQ